MRLLITGGAGFLGQELVKVLSREHQLTVLDVRAGEFCTNTTWQVGDVSDYKYVCDLIKGQDALVIAHMAPRNPDSYATPERSFDINVRGTANLFQAALVCGVRKVVMISSLAAVQWYGKETPVWGETPPQAVQDIYGLTKVLQEHIAEHYMRTSGFEITVLRIGGLVDASSLMDKYGNCGVNPGGIAVDRGDVARAVALSLTASHHEYRVYHLIGQADAVGQWDTAAITRELGWEPLHRFTIKI